MEIYVANLLVVYLSSCFARIIAKTRRIDQISILHPSSLFIFIALCSLVTVAGLRYKVGTDYPTYYGLISYFYQLSVDQIINSNNISDKGFVLITWLIGRFTDEAQVAFFIYALLIIFLVILTIKDFGKPFELAMALYITGFAYYSSFNGMRQWIASAFIFWAIRYLLKGNWKKYFLVVILSSTLHLSALLMIVAYVLVRWTNWKYTSIGLSIFFGGAFILYSGFIESLFSLLDGSQYGHYDSVLKSTDNGANIFRILVWAVPIVSWYLFRGKFEQTWPEGKYVLRLSFIGFLFAVLALKNASIYRICMYFDIYNILIVPRLATIFRGKVNYVIYYCIFVCYFLYSYMLLPYDSNLLPYRFYNIFG